MSIKLQFWELFTARWSAFWALIFFSGTSHLVQNSLCDSYLPITASKRLVMCASTWHSCQNWMSELNRDNFVHYLGQERVLSNLSGDLIVTLQFRIPVKKITCKATKPCYVSFTVQQQLTQKWKREQLQQWTHCKACVFVFPIIVPKLNWAVSENHQIYFQFQSFQQKQEFVYQMFRETVWQRLSTQSFHSDYNFIFDCFIFKAYSKHLCLVSRQKEILIIHKEIGCSSGTRRADLIHYIAFSKRQFNNKKVQTGPFFAIILSGLWICSDLATNTPRGPTWRNTFPDL